MAGSERVISTRSQAINEAGIIRIKEEKNKEIKSSLFIWFPQISQGWINFLLTLCKMLQIIRQKLFN